MAPNAIGDGDHMQIIVEREQTLTVPQQPLDRQPMHCAVPTQGWHQSVPLIPTLPFA